VLTLNNDECAICYRARQTVLVWKTMQMVSFLFIPNNSLVQENADAFPSKDARVIAAEAAAIPPDWKFAIPPNVNDEMVLADENYTNNKMTIGLLKITAPDHRSGSTNAENGSTKQQGIDAMVLAGNEDTIPPDKMVLAAEEVEAAARGEAMRVAGTADEAMAIIENSNGARVIAVAEDAIPPDNNNKNRQRRPWRTTKWQGGGG